MEKLKLFLCTVFVIGLLSGCGSKLQLPDDPMVYKCEISEKGYAYLTFEDKIYVPYCAYEQKYLGDCIGYCMIPGDEYTEEGKSYICECKGFSSYEWIIELLDRNCSEGMIFREIHVTEIPEGLVSEYEWNNDQ